MNKKIIFCISICGLLTSKVAYAPVAGAVHGNKLQASTMQESMMRGLNVVMTTTVNPATVLTAFVPGQQPELYVGLTEVQGTDKANFALSRVTLDQYSTPSVRIDPIAPAMASLNGAAAAANPLYGQVITNMALFDGTMPLVTINDQKVYLVTNPSVGSTLLSNSGTDIQDAAAMPITTPVTAIAGSSTNIFAAVAAVGSAGFGDNTAAGLNRGIAVLQKNPTQLTVLNAGNGAVGTTPAAKLDVTAYNDSIPAQQKKIEFAFFDSADMPNVISQANVGSNLAMTFSPELNRLYVGFSQAKRNNNNQAGGVLGVGMGYMQPAANTVPAVPTILTIAPIVASPTKAQFYDTSKVPVAANVNANDLVIGFYYDGTTPAGAGAANSGTDDVGIFVNNLLTMHTSTNKDYLLVNSFKPATAFNVLGAMFQLPSETKIQALPLLPAAGNAANVVGTLSRVQDMLTLGNVATFDAPPTTIAQMPRAGDAAVMVGGGNPAMADFTEVFVAGDAVYVCAAGNDAGQAGIFQSTALFGATGAIIGWTPLQRVMGSVERVYGAGLDDLTGNYYLLTEQNKFDPNNPNVTSSVNTAQITQWGRSENVKSSNLSSLLATLFPQNFGGVHQLFTFDEQTPGFSLENFSMMVAVGLGQVALVQTGSQINGQFIPVTNFFASAADAAASGIVGATQNVFVFNGPELQNIGPISCAELSRSTANYSGWLFVGGYNGVAVLSADGTGLGGNGFASQAPGLAGLSLNVGGYPGNNFSFKVLVPSNGGLFDHTRKLACLNGYLYVMTGSNLYSVALDDTRKFDEPPMTRLGETPINLAPTVPAGACLTDFIIIAGVSGLAGFRAVLATSMGLFQITNTTGTALIPTQDVVTEIKIPDQSGVLQSGLPIVQLQYLSNAKGIPGTIGNLHVLTADLSKAPSTGKVYRFVVDAITVAIANFIQPIMIDNGLLTDFQEFRGNIFDDGSLILNSRSKLFGDTNFLDITPVSGTMITSQITNLLDLDLGVNYNIGAPIRESASGVLIAPGDWGVRVNG